MATKRRTLDELKNKILSNSASKHKFEMLKGESFVLSLKVKSHKNSGLDKNDIESAKMKVI